MTHVDRGDARRFGVFDRAFTPTTEQPAAVADPTGGVTQDAEARAAVVAILAALRAYGLIKT